MGLKNAVISEIADNKIHFGSTHIQFWFPEGSMSKWWWGNISEHDPHSHK